MVNMRAEGALALPLGLLEWPNRVATAERSYFAGGVLQSLYDNHGNQVYKFIFHKVGNREDAEDLTSQVFLKAAQSLDTARDAQSMLAWLYQVARTTVADHWRAHYRAGTLSIEELSEDQGKQYAAVQQQPAPAVETPEQAQVAVILAMLPQNYRRVLEFRFLLGYSLKETAAAMNITEGNVKVLQYRALQKASKQL